MKMQRYLTAACFVLFMGCLDAQGAFTTPPGFVTIEGGGIGGVPGNGYCSQFGGHAFGRYQILDGETKSRGAQVLGSVGYFFAPSGGLEGTPDPPFGGLEGLIPPCVAGL